MLCRKNIKNNMDTLNYLQYSRWIIIFLTEDIKKMFCNIKIFGYLYKILNIRNTYLEDL